MINLKKTALGIELGSTRIKSVLIDEKAKVLAQGSFEWKNILVDGLWSYSLDEAIKGVQDSFAALAREFEKNYGTPLTEVGSMGISAMMHGYIPLDKEDRLLAPFRTWRNTNTAEASDELSNLFQFHVPMRWSVSQYYQSVLEGLSHVDLVAFMTTLAGYIHYLLTGEKVLGVDDASGMFPTEGNHYHPEMMKKFNSLLAAKGKKADYESLLPKVLVAGEAAGVLTEKGAKLLDPTGTLRSGIPLCPPEGDMGTGVVATNCVNPRQGNVSFGTSANFTVVLEKPLKRFYPEVDIVATPEGHHCALLHTNNCTTEIDEWAALFSEVLSLYGVESSKGKMLDLLFAKSAESDEKVGDMVAYNFLAGEPIVGTDHGFPMLGRSPEGKMNLANFMQTQIYSAISTVSLGMELLQSENVKIDSIYGHGGFFKAPLIGQTATSAALGGVPVTVSETAGEGGAWGMALLALYMQGQYKSLADFLSTVFATVTYHTLTADAKEQTKFNHFYTQYKKYLPVEKEGTKKC